MRAIFIAATGQNVGKTTLCLGLLSGLRKRRTAVGFLKPIGQQHAASFDGSEVDKDVILFKDHFHLTPSYTAMSPVICPHGFTKDYLDHKFEEKNLLQKITESFEQLARENEFVLVEGTGHIGVGSIFHLNNAKIAKHLGIDVVIVVTGGLGSSFDELELNLNMCYSSGVKVHGVILNKVHDDKRKMILEYFPKSLQASGIPLIGCIPYEPFLMLPTLHDLQLLFRAEFLSGNEQRFHHFNSIHLVAGSLESFYEEHAPNQLIITSACREDIILQMLRSSSNNGMILTGKKSPSPEIAQAIRQSDLPILYVPMPCYEVTKAITCFTAKIRNEDNEKVERAIKLVEDHINFDLLLTPHH